MDAKIEAIDLGRLVLDRKEGEAVLIGQGQDQVRVEVTRGNGNRVKLLIQAPRDVRIIREELLAHE